MVTALLSHKKGKRLIYLSSADQSLNSQPPVAKPQSAVFLNNRLSNCHSKTKEQYQSKNKKNSDADSL